MMDIPKLLMIFTVMTVLYERGSADGYVGERVIATQGNTQETRAAVASPWFKQTRPSRPIRCDVWIVERMRYPTNQLTDQPTDQPTDTASYRGA